MTKSDDFRVLAEFIKDGRTGVVISTESDKVLVEALEIAAGKIRTSPVSGPVREFLARALWRRRRNYEPDDDQLHGSVTGKDCLADVDVILAALAKSGHAQSSGLQNGASDLPLIWRGWANALRLMDSKRSDLDLAAQAQANAYEQCAVELREALAQGPDTSTDRNHTFVDAGFDTCRFCGERKGHADHAPALSDTSTDREGT